MKVMLDLETLGVNPGCVILSIGACSIKEKPEDTRTLFHRKISIESCLSVGLMKETSTMLWWNTQPPSVFEACSNGTAPLREALEEYREIFGAADEVWGNGADFDLPILRAAARLYGIPIARPFAARCFRTMKELWPMQKAKNLNKHDALADALWQAEYLEQIFFWLKSEQAGSNRLEILSGALQNIISLDPDTNSDEGYNEWGEADCFRQAQKIAAEAMKEQT